MNEAQNPIISLEHPDLYIDRELSLLAFNKRVLELAEDSRIPLLERLKFLCISCSNLDEFFEVRVAGIKQQADQNVAGTETYSLNPKIVLGKIHEQAHELVDQQYECLNKRLLPALEQENIRVLKLEDWNDEQNKWLQSYFEREVLPLLTPIGLHRSQPFPLTINKGLCIVIHIQNEKTKKKHLNLAVIPVPRALPRLINLPTELNPDETDKNNFVYLASIIKHFAQQMIPHNTLVGAYQLRITRNSDLFVDPEAVEDLVNSLEGELPSRRYGEAVRLEVSSDCPKKIADFLLSRFNLNSESLYQSDGPVNLNRLIVLPNLINRPDLKYTKFKPGMPQQMLGKKSIFAAIREKDILLHHPYQSFVPIIDLIKSASCDPDVLVIKQTLYRMGKESVILEHLMDAARAGKEVTVVIELLARFDEETNISAALKLQKAGVHVVYGMIGRKTHAKMLMIVRRERGKLKRYCHLGTGNYHQRNTKAYTDYGYITNNKSITEDVHKIFMQLTTYGENQQLETLFQSPHGIREMLLNNIEREIKHAQEGKPSKVIAKMNGLVSPLLIQALYKASQAGVQIDLIIRGICCLRPGVPGVSDNIRVHSILGRFLEHGRVYWFHNNSQDKIFIASADWMPRNMNNRVEQCVPILNDDLKQRLISDMTLYLNDNQHRWEMDQTGQYTLVSSPSSDSVSDTTTDREVTQVCAQQTLLKQFATHDN